MKRIILRIIILFGVFVVSLAAFMFFLNRHEVASTGNMAEPSLPVLYMRQADVTTNRMFGYRQEINEDSLRETLTLLPADRNLTVEIQPFSAEIKGITYQVSSFEDGTVIENGRIKSIRNTDGNQIGEFHIDNSIRMGQEYMLKFIVDIGDGEPVNYYTRIVQRTGQNIRWYLDYVDAFYQNCINKNMTDEMLSQMETDSSLTNSSMHTVTLKSDKDQITWGNLAPSLAKKAVPTVLEVNEKTVSIRLDYIIMAQDTDNNNEYYTVTEFYRMRKAQEQVVLLDFERQTTQFFNGNINVLTGEGLNLGITGKDAAYVTNNAADIAAFVQAGELWLYDRGANKVTRLFSYSGFEHNDERTENHSYNISVSSVSDQGDTTFVVYGYRNAGTYEGKLGISVYRYTASDNTTKEKVFIPIKDAFQLADQGLSRLAYVNSKDQCFLYYDDVIYSIRLETGEVKVLEKGLDWQTVSVSDSQMLVSWGDADQNGFSKTVRELNLETGETISIDAPEGDYIKALGYMGEDIIYGLSHAAECYTDTTGNEIFPMYRVSVRTQAGDLVEDYMIEGVYVTGIEIDDDIIIMNRLMNTDGMLRPCSSDQLIHYAPEKSKAVDVKLKVTERQGTQVHLVFAVWGESSNLLSLNTRYHVDGEENRLEIPEMAYGKNSYYVYAKGKLYALYKMINKAIAAADNSVGVVLNDRQQYAWERGNIKDTVQLDIASIPPELLNAPVEEEAVARAVGDGYNVWNLSGCSLSSICYQISNGYAVSGRWSEYENKLIVGYDQYNIWLFDINTGGSYPVTFEDAEAAFGACGNIFISYHKK